MKLTKSIRVLAALVLAVPLFAALGSQTAPATCCNAIVSTTLVDEPPPDPVECIFCGGNPELHKTRMKALLRFSAALFESMVP